MILKEALEEETRSLRNEKMLKKHIEFKVEGITMVRKKASKHTGYARIYLPKDWGGKEVVIILLE